MNPKQYFIYILKSSSGVLYIGITSNLQKRLYEHKAKLVKGFTQRYHVDKLIYYEIYENPLLAIEREKQLKNWNRQKKIHLITMKNPGLDEIGFEEIV